MLFGKKKNEVIVCLDTTNDGSAFLDDLHKTLKGYDLIYISDPLSLPYEGRKEEEIESIIGHMLDKALEYNPKCVMVFADGLYEYGQNALKKCPVPVIYLTELLLDCLKGYEQKNIALALKEEALSSNIYQKAVKYNHLYTISLNHMALDSSNEVEFNYEVNFKNTCPKTEESFALIDQLVSSIKEKEIDVFLTSSPRLNRFNIEIGEFLKNGNGIDCDCVNITEVLIKAIKGMITVNEKNKVGTLKIISSQKEQILKEELSDLKTVYLLEE